MIEAVRNKGYRLVEEADVLTVAELHSVLDTEWLGKELEYYYETDSTNNRARDAAEKGASHSPIAGISIGGDFEALDHNGEPVTQKILQGHYSLVYFGFTYCPAICPTELQKISATLETLQQQSPELADQIQPVFITIDPERDTPAVMKDYISLFHPRLIGLSGTPEQIDHIKQVYRVYAKKVESEEMSEYTMDHSSYIYLLDQNGALISIYKIDDTAGYMARDITARLNG